MSTLPTLIEESVGGRRLSRALVALWYVAALAGAVTAVAHVLAYVQVAVTRMPFPYTLEWMEGGSLVQVSRILSGGLLYVRPSLDFIPQVYPPVFFYVAAMASRLVGTGFVALRLVSFLASLAVLVLIGLIVRRASRSALAGLLAAGLFCSAYALSGHWYDVARVDTLALALVLTSAFMLLRDNPISCALGGVALALACLTKQTYAFLAIVPALYLLVPPRRNGLIFIGTALAAFAGLTFALDRIHGGWYLYYVFSLPARHSLFNDSGVLLRSMRDFLVRDLLTPIPVAVSVGLIYWFLFPGRPATPGSEGPADRPDRRAPQGERAVWGVLTVAAVMGLISVIYLVLLPSDLERAVIGRYSLARLGLIGGQVIFVGLVAALSVLFARRPGLSTKVGTVLDRDPRTVPRVLLFFTLASALAFLALWKFEPQPLEHVTRAHLERLLPYLAGPAAILALLTISWGLRWGSTRRTAWLSIVFAGALVASSFLGRLNPGGYLNVLMPAFAGVSILFGLGVSEAAKPFSRHSPGLRRIAGVVVLALAAGQLIVMPSPLASPLPSEADAAAGTALVRKIAECPGDVYLPFQTYLSQLAGKSPHAGWIETAELAGFFGGGPDPLWEEVKGQIEGALRSRSFAGVIQDNFVFGELLSDEYEPVGKVFSRDDLFWPVTGWRIRPEVIYQPVGRETCDLEVE